ncbi:uncharacterized protein LOC133724179 isoform X4 [Rosa rugosa]|uniref:uncharacterized protein LOC133724179 isoform X4 n=1 Tax=Rosa rugosa TaxID=74645 RepID=UPI002B40B361|nr:uncharacterized protein LOC133724179 isoform X4 [Rosa rugosa]
MESNLSAMAANLSNEGKPYIHGISDGIPAGCPSVKLLKSAFDEVDQHCSLDILPILFEEAQLPAKLKYPFHRSHAPDVFNMSMLPKEDNRPQWGSLLALLSFLKVSNPFKSQMCMDAQLTCQNCDELQQNNGDAHPPFIMEIAIEKEYNQAPESEEEAVESLKSGGELRVLQRQMSPKVGGKLMQLLFDHGTSKDNPVTEKTYETPNNRWRRCKRNASFDSRKIVLLFSVLSSLGTLVLIYLTLRVRQSGDGLVLV